MDTTAAKTVAAVRAFNRDYTKIIGVLHEGLVDSEYSLTEARVLFELAAAPHLEALTLRKTLDLDAGYLSRILTKFDNAGLLERQRSDTDGRRQQVRLTERGLITAATLDQRSSDEVAALLANRSPAERTRLLDAMRTIRDLLGENTAPASKVVLRTPEPGDYGWVIERHARLYAGEYGWDGSYENLIVRIITDYLDTHDPARERAWIAEVDGHPVGSIFCVTENETTARLRLLLVEPSARGLGVGSTLVNACLAFATEAGYREMVLWTNDVLTAARHIYQRAGFTLAEQEQHHSWGQDLTGQTWRRPLP